MLPTVTAMYWGTKVTRDLKNFIGHRHQAQKVFLITPEMKALAI